MEKFLEFDHITKKYGNLTAVNDTSLSIDKGEFFSLLGPSGCGKTTLLRILAGFERPDHGKIFLNGQDITWLPPNQRQVNMIFQNYALFPHLTLWENIAFGLKVAGKPAKLIKKEVASMLYLIQMEEYADKKPHQISGGQKQRVAIARALIKKPQVLLLDEPLAALDLKLRQHMLMELDLIHDQVGITFLYVTHDQGEAMSLSDRMAVMNNGKIEQLGTPTQIYEAPQNGFVAAFIGDTNFFEGQVVESIDQDYIRLRIDDFAEVVCFNDKNLGQNQSVYLSIRPEKFRISREKPNHGANLNCHSGKVQDVIYLGTHTKYWVAVNSFRLEIYQQHSRFLLDEKPIRWNEDVWIAWSADDGYMLEKFQESDEQLIFTPPQQIGEADQESPIVD